MLLNHIEKTYSEIFKSYSSPKLDEHINKIIELDFYLPHSSTFFCITNTQTLAFEYISKNMFTCIGIANDLIKEKGMRYFWSRIHPDDLNGWLTAMDNLMKFTLSEIAENDRHKLSYTWNYRFKIANENYVNIIQNTTPLQYDSEHKPIIGLAHYTVVSSEIKMDVCASAKILNDNNEYETKYFNNFSQKLLSTGITNRERDIIRLLVLKYSSKDIAVKLNISFNTVNTHRRNILKKLNISTTGELVGMLKINKLLI